MMFYVLVFVVGVSLGAAGYRYYLKRDPEKLEAWAKLIKEKADALRAKV